MTWLREHWPALAALTAALVLAASWSFSHRARVSAERDAEQARLALKGQIVASDASKKDLQAGIAKLLSDNELLRQAYEAAKAAAPGAQPKATAHLNTKPFKIEPSTCYAAGEGDLKGSFVPVPCKPPGELVMPAVGTGPAPEPVQCLLKAGDDASVEATIITLMTQQQNLIIAGTAEIYRDTPPPRVKLGEGPFTASLSDFESLAPPVEPRWGALALGLCAGAGCGIGAAVLLPPWRVLGLRVEALAGVFLGPQPGALGGLGVRF